MPLMVVAVGVVGLARGACKVRMGEVGDSGPVAATLRGLVP